MLPGRREGPTDACLVCLIFCGSGVVIQDCRRRVAKEAWGLAVPA